MAVGNPNRHLHSSGQPQGKAAEVMDVAMNNVIGATLTQNLLELPRVAPRPGSINWAGPNPTAECFDSRVIGPWCVCMHQEV